MQTIDRIDLSPLKKCEQDWNKMPKIGDGRLCEKCTKKIVDFTGKSQSEIADIHLNSEQPVCGFYKKEQLANPSTSIGKSYSLKVWLAGLLAFIATLGMQAKTSKKIIPTEQISPDFKPITKLQPTNQSDTVQKKIRIKGSVKERSSDSTLSPFPYATIIVKGSKVGTMADGAGNFELDITEMADTTDYATLVFHYIGYETVEKQISVKNSSSVESITLETEFIIEEEHISVEAFYVVEKKSSWYKRLWHTIITPFR